MSRTLALLSDIIAPALAAAGVDLEDLDLTQAGERRALRVVVDRDGGAGLGTLAELTRELSGLLDAAEPFGDAAYELEVTTPGIDRPLTAERHWRRARGRTVEVTRTDGTSVTGRVGPRDDEQVTLITADKGRVGEVRVAFADVERAVVQVDFSRPGEAVLRRCGLTDDEIAERRTSATAM